MSTVLTAFTLRGVALALRLRDLLGEGQVWTKEKFKENGILCYNSLSHWTGEQFRLGNDIIFVSAAGIAVRAIAPYVRDKLTDPAVVSVDELGQFVVPLLSGHVGGANRLARRVANLLGAVPVISTATDLNRCFAVDEWAAAQGMTIENRSAAKAVSAALLAGESVGFWSELPHDQLPEGVTDNPGVPGFAVTCETETRFPAGMLVLHPQLLAVGIGCKKDLPPEQVEETVSMVLKEHNLSPKSVFALASIDLKQDEEGIRRLGMRWGVPCRFYSAAQLTGVPGNFTPSSFVQTVTGVDNVCERSAVLCAENGELLVHKTARNGVTVAVARKPCFVRFSSGEEG